MAKRTAKKGEEPPSFEDTVKRLEQILETLEKEDTPLADSLQAFESGIALVREAQELLAKAEQKVRLLTEKNGEPDIEVTDYSEVHE